MEARVDNNKQEEGREVEPRLHRHWSQVFFMCCCYLPGMDSKFQEEIEQQTIKCIDDAERHRGMFSFLKRLSWGSGTCQF